MRQSRPRKLLLLTLTGVLNWCAAPAMAQLGTDLSQQLIGSTQPTPEQIETISKYVQARVADLESGDAARMKRGRDDLQSPATNAGATIGFRAAYSEALLPQLDRLGKLDNDQIVINAVQIGGTLATAPAIAFVEKYRADPRPAVRYAAVFGLRDTIRSISRTSPAVEPAEIARVVDNLGAGLSTETYASVADMYVRALLESIRVDRAKFEAIPNQAFGLLVRTISSRVRKLGNGPEDRALLQSVIRASEEVRNFVVEDRVFKKQPQNLVVDAGGLGGDLLGYVFRQVRAGNLAMAAGADQAAIDKARAERQVETTLTQLGVNIVFAANDVLASGALVDSPDLAGMISQGTSKGDKDFLREVGSIIGEGGLGLLTKPPFNFNANRFLNP